MDILCLKEDGLYENTLVCCSTTDITFGVNALLFECLFYVFSFVWSDSSVGGDAKRSQLLLCAKRVGGVVQGGVAM